MLNRREDLQMTLQIQAIYDGEVFRPERPLDLPVDSKVCLTIQVSDSRSAEPYSFLNAAESLNLPGPADWSANVRDYLYPNPK